MKKKNIEDKKMEDLFDKAFPCFYMPSLDFSSVDDDMLSFEFKKLDMLSAAGEEPQELRSWEKEKNIDFEEK